MEVYNTDKLSEEFIWQDSMGLITTSLSAAAGSRKIYVNVDSVPPECIQYQISQPLSAGRIFSHNLRNGHAAAE